MGIRVLQNSQPEALYAKLTVPVRIKKQGLPLGMEHEERELRVISTEELRVMCAAKRRSWSVRTLRWFHKVPLNILGTLYELQGSKTALKRWVCENVPTTGDEILHGKFTEKGGKKGGDKDREEDNEPPSKKRRRGRMQGEEELRRDNIVKSRQQKFIIDWMKSGEKGTGGHTCILGSRVRTGGTVMEARRRIEGVIIQRLWKGDHHCEGCNLTELEINQDRCQSENQGWSKEIGEERRELELVQKWSRHKVQKKPDKVLKLLIWLLVAICRSWEQKYCRECEVSTTVRMKILKTKVEEEQLFSEARKENWVKSGVG